MTDTIQTLTQFNLTETDEGYRIQIAGDDGAAMTLNASAEQIDAIIDSLDELLAEDDASADEV